MKQFIFIAGKMISILMMLVTSISVSAQNDSGLQHKELPQDKIKEAIVGSILDAIIIPSCNPARRQPSHSSTKCL